MTMNHPANRQALYAATLAHFPQHDVNPQAVAFIAGGRATPCKSGSDRPVAPRSRIHGGFTLWKRKPKPKPNKMKNCGGHY